MTFLRSLRSLPFLAAGLCASVASAQHAQVTNVAVQPGNPARVWVCNKDNGTVSVIDVTTSQVLSEIPVGVHPSSLAFDQAGTHVFVANRRGDVPIDRNFVSPFNGTELRGSVSVIDVATHTVTSTLSDVGVEPYGIVTAPNGKYFAVSGTRQGTLKFYDAATLAPLVTLQFPRDLSNIAPPLTMADVDSNRDGVADTGEPRGFVIRSDSQRIYVVHNKSPFVSVVDVTLNFVGLPTAASVLTKINTDQYPFDTVFNPVPVQTIQSQGKPRFLEDIALSPDGAHLAVPHVLANINHDVNFNFGPGLAGNFANRIYPALTILDATNNSFGQPGDGSRRLHNELSDPLHPAEFVPFGRGKVMATGGLPTLGGVGAPIPGTSVTFVVSGMVAGQTAQLILGQSEVNVFSGSLGTLLVRPRFVLNMTGNSINYTIPASATNFVGIAQALITDPSGEQAYSTALRWVTGSAGHGLDKLGYRAGQPQFARYSPSGNSLLMLNRGSEDLFLYKVSGNDLELQTVFPPRYGFTPRAPLDTSSPLGDLPLGMAVVPDTTTTNDDARVYVLNEVTRTLSVLRVDWTAGTIQKLKNQIPTHLGADAMTSSQILGEELFEDASRPQTSGNFNNSCASCHFEGGEDANVWQRSNGPRSTMPTYGGTLGTGLILWKGVRLNMGETGPMFGGENGGTGILSDAEQTALRDFHEIMPYPLNPNLNPVGSGYSSLAAFGKDLYFGLNNTGLNPSLRHAGCAVCHPDFESNPGSFPGPRAYTADFINPQLSHGETLGQLDPTCFSLQQNIVAINIRNVNTGTDVDINGDGIPDLDRNFDGYTDLETYAIMNPDKDDGFRRDDGNSYLCPCDPATDPNCDATNPFTLFARNQTLFSIPQKLGIFSSGPYFHDHAAYSLRALLDPDVQALSPIYGSPAFPGQPAYPGLDKIFNEVHDLRGHEQFVQGVSKVQLTLQSGTNIQNDIEALLAYISSL
jgi:YVTN family beta-propeller protein